MVAVLDYPLAQALGAYRGVIMPMLVLLGLALLAGCVIAPVGPRHPYYGYYRPRVAVVAPAPVVVVRP